MIILGLDANDNVRTGDVNAMLRMRGLVDVHAATHPHLATESTCDKNTQEIPVDGIWATPALECISAGYYGFGELVMGKTDHRMIWADFTYESALGFEPPKPVYRAPQRLTLTDPRVIKKYNKILRQEHTRQRLDQRAFALQESIPQGLTLQHQQEYETLAHLDLCARRHANKKCRKLRMGALEYSDTMKITRGAIDLWDLMARKRNGMKSSTKKIRRLMRLTGENTGLQETLPAIISKQKLAMKAYRKLKKQAAKERESFGKRLIKARAEWKPKGTNRSTQRESSDLGR
jgi:hypothetical protein